MLKNGVCPVLVLMSCSLAAPSARAEPCYNTSDMACVVYQVCRAVLDKFPESEITEKGKDCILTIDGRQLIIRRKKTGGGTKYFMFARTPAGKKKGVSIKPAAGAKKTAKKTSAGAKARYRLKKAPAKKPK